MKKYFHSVVKIGPYKIGKGQPSFIIAEAGSNHNKNFSLAKKLIKAAVAAQANAVKFQLFVPDKLYAAGAGSADYLGDSQSIHEILDAVKMPTTWIQKLSLECKTKKILFLCSAFDETSVDLIDPYVAAHKIASYELTHLPLIKHIAKKGKPILLSTAMANIDEIQEALEVIAKTGNRNVVLMQCTACYPNPIEDSHLRVIPALQDRFHIPVGLSDHSRNPFVNPIAATALGGNILEKHFTLDNNLPGPDHQFAITPDELHTLIQSVRETEMALGSPLKKLLPVEKELFTFARRHIHAIRPIKKGEKLSKENIAILRSGKVSPGLPPRDFEWVCGKRAARNISQGRGIRKGDVE